jgi:hypothetical protein
MDARMIVKTAAKFGRGGLLKSSGNRTGDPEICRSEKLCWHFITPTTCMEMRQLKASMVALAAGSGLRRQAMLADSGPLRSGIF